MFNFSTFVKTKLPRTNFSLEIFLHKERGIRAILKFRRNESILRSFPKKKKIFGWIFFKNSSLRIPSIKSFMWYTKKKKYSLFTRKFNIQSIIRIARDLDNKVCSREAFNAPLLKSWDSPSNRSDNTDNDMQSCRCETRPRSWKRYSAV